jgi:CSLREA domain-containing protein
VRVGEAGGRSVTGALIAALIVLACALALPALAAAESFEVNSTADETDAVPGNEFCLTASGKCTLRAALEESNALEGEDTIGFTEAPFDGGVGGTIALGSSLPTIVGVVSIEGECVVGNVLRPCVGVAGPGPSEPALVVENTEAVQVDGLAITNAEAGIEVVGTPRFKALSDWLGVKLDGATGANGTGILLGPGSNNSRIGNGGEANVFANSSADGLDIHGARGVTVLGGYFGVGPDGVTPAANGKDIEVASFGGFEAVGTTIGAQLATAARETPECDGGCNVISGSESSGIDLEGDGGEETPAIATEIVGNFVGLDASGSASVPNATAGIHVGQASGTVIGGPRASEVNRLSGGGVGVDAGPAATNLVVRGNSIGVGADGESLAAPGAGVVIDSGGLFGPVAEAVVTDNEIRMRGGVAIDLNGFGGWIAGNEISGADTGISTYDPTEEHGNLIQGNLIEGSAINGVLVESSFNEILGNEILGSGGAGISLEGTHALFGFGVSGNLIGGDGKADENLIAGSGGAAIAITNLTNTSNEVARNRGFANAGLFIDLLAADPKTEPKGPNRGIVPPKVLAVSGLGVSGFDALPGARIRVFRKASAEAGEIESTLGEAVAGKDGAWDVAYDAPVPAGTTIAVTQTGPGSGTSELVVATTPAEPVGGRARACTGSCGGPGAGNPPSPQTKIFKGPKGKKFVGATAAFKFAANVDGSTFQCSLDGAPLNKCHTPTVYTGLRAGKHVFKVRAVNSAGAADPTPAKLKFTVLG